MYIILLVFQWILLECLKFIDVKYGCTLLNVLYTLKCYTYLFNVYIIIKNTVDQFVVCLFVDANVRPNHMHITSYIAKHQEYS